MVRLAPFTHTLGMKHALAALLLAAASVSSAKDHKGHEGSDPLRQACGADVERLCPGSPNPGKCLHQHWDQVSESCKSFKEGMRKQRLEKHGGKHASHAAKHDAWREHCGADVDRLCAGAADPGACLHENWKQVSDGCKAFKEGMKSRRQEKHGPKHHSFENGMKPEKGDAARKGKMKFEWTNGEPKPEAAGE
jgi:hypothetical protein